MTTEDFKKISDSIPHQPGVYQFQAEDNDILYVGKAKSLRKRLASYFGNKSGQAYKTRAMVRNAHHIDFTIVETEQDALLLENTMIKKYQPKYNVDLKDGKSYTYICVKKERFPRVFFTRKMIKDGSTYFGPYTSKYRAKIVLEMIKSLFPLRTCSFFLSEKNIKANKFKVCLEYHIKNCLGPCVGFEEEADYNEKILQVKNMLNGNFGAVKSHLKREMKGAAERLDFETAQQLKIKLDALNDYQSKSTVVSQSIKNADVFTIVTDDKDAFVNYLKVVNGAVINSHTLEMTQNLNTDKTDLLIFGIQNLREKFNSLANEIIVPFELELPNPDLKITVPKRGEKAKLIELAEKNGKYFLLQKKKEAINKSNKETSAERILKTLQEDLRMDKIPWYIECFDNSNIQGSNPVASCVVFKNAKPANKDYRHYNIKTVEGPNDFASMEEIVYRRYKRLLEEGKDFPQLIIIDGGKGQLSAAMKSIYKLGIQKQVRVIGIAKRLEEIYFPGDPLPLYINKKSESLKLIQQARNEAHRFAITFHRRKRMNDMTGTDLTNIPGIGEKTAQKLLVKFKSLKKLKEASFREIREVIGRSAASKVMKWYHDEEE
ncbi:MAG: excinuclease ABC subunit UvrC [Bacteroidota bacterium]